MPSMTTTPHPLSLSKALLDPIHGLVRLSAEEMDVIAHPAFQRLRGIKQNGLLFLVFPSATHTRFEHSIGALFVADSILQALQFNWLSVKGKVGDFGDNSKEGVNAGEGRLIDWQAVPQDEIQFLYRACRLSALCHDLGHGPLSHTFEAFAPRSIHFDSLIAHLGLAGLLPLKDMLKQRLNGHARIPHELFSCLFFAKAWYDLYGSDSNDVVIAVTCAIMGLAVPTDCGLGQRFEKWLPLLHDIVASAPADADRMDYVERDSRSCGVSYGLFDRSRVLKSFLAYFDVDGVPRLGIKHSGYRAIENFIQARFELFVQVYYHKTNRAIEYMLKEISELAFDDEVIDGSAGFDKVFADFGALSDESFLSALCGDNPKFPLIHSKINDIANCVRSRKLWKRIFDPKESGFDISAPVMLEKLRNGADVYVDKVDPKATKDLHAGARLLRKRADGSYELAKGKKWSDLSPLIEALEKEEKDISRVYVRSSDKALVKDLRAKAIDLAGTEPERTKHGDRS